MVVVLVVVVLIGQGLGFISKIGVVGGFGGKIYIY